MRFCVVNLGCKVNRVESDDFIAAFLEAGGVYDDTDQAELVVVNSCTVTAEAAKKSRKTVRGILRNYPRARVVVTGCAAVIEGELFQELDGRLSVWSKQQVLEQAKTLKSQEGQCESERFLRLGDRFPTRVNIKVQDGCNNACSFCIVHVARGSATSKPFDEIVDEVVAYSDQGTAEIVLTGINLGSYRQQDSDITTLLKTLLEKTDGTRFRLSSIEPRDVSTELIQLMAQAEGRICRHLHIPLQAGSSKVLAEMKRNYDRDYYRDLVVRLYKAMPEMSLTTDVIVGFPGESDAEFEETCSLAQECMFCKIHVFPYSRREGTPAALRQDQVPSSLKTQRAKKLRNLADELRFCDKKKRAGTTEMALVERKGLALTESYYHVAVPENVEPSLLVPYKWSI